jgi:hypothetical protein
MFQVTEPASPAPAALWASAPKVATDVALAVLAAVAVLHGVADAADVQVYVIVSPAGGLATDGPPAAKSAVIFTVIVPAPPTFVDRTLYRKLVVPVNAAPNVLDAVDIVVVAEVTLIAASGLTVTDNVLVPVAANCACAVPMENAASRIAVLIVVVIFIVSSELNLKSCRTDRELNVRSIGSRFICGVVRQCERHLY